MNHREERIVCYDSDLKIEALSLRGIVQKFPNHFHEHYVIGFIESGQRKLSCKNKTYTLGPGDLLLFNPYDNHCCEQVDDQPLDYRCLNIKPEVMAAAVFEITGRKEQLRFESPVISHCEQVALLGEVHDMLMKKHPDFHQEELFLFLIAQLIEEYGSWAGGQNPQAVHAEIEVVCDYLEKNYPQRISLNDLAVLSGCSKYYLVRAFTKIKGITPYRYLETVRINAAKRLLEQGVEPLETALQTGFSDQSHFSNFFKGFIGITPRQYQKIFTATGEPNFPGEGGQN
jgi:AraC-like DNA-binding protein/mannose-6-phosphate isomerase-like protein (cupin superfamily)